MKYFITFTEPKTIGRELWNVAVWVSALFGSLLAVLSTVAPISVEVVAVAMVAIVVFTAQYYYRHAPDRGWADE